MGEINGVSRADRLNGLGNSKTVELQRRKKVGREGVSRREEQASHLSRISDLTESE